MKKKLLAMLLSLVLAVTLFPVTASASAWDGSTMSEPEIIDGVYQISSGAELAWFANEVNSQAAAESGLVALNAVLTSDIDLGGNAWTPISTTSYVIYAYSGSFNGMNHTISGLNINASRASYGLFGLVNGGTISNLKVSGNVSSNNVVGGIIGKLQTGTVENCSFSGSISTTGASTKGYVGGIIGTVNTNGAVIKGCLNTADVSGTYAGGIIGYNKNSATISYCYNTGSITGSTRSAGIAGQQSKGSISYCYNIGNSTNGIAGFSNASITNCYYLYDEASAPGGTASGYTQISGADELLSGLSSGSEQLFSADSKNINNGYPVLNWQLASSVIAVPVASVNILGNAVTGSELTTQALGAEGESATNVSYQWSVSPDNDVFTDIADSAASKFNIPDTVDYSGKYIKVTVKGEDNSTAYAVMGPIVKSAALIKSENDAKVQSALETISFSSNIIKSASPLDFPKEIDGCTVTWSSSRDDIISSDGIVVLPEKNIVAVSLTASVTYADSTASKTFDFDVWAEDIDPDVYLQKVLDSMEWSFSSLQPVYGTDTNIIVKFQNILKNKGFDGVKVTINSSADESLVSKNGKISYPAIPTGGSFAEGKQVKVSFSLTVGDKTVTYPTEDIYALLIPWDTSDVKDSLEASADKALTSDIIKGDNEDLSSVIDDLVLPSCISGDKRSFAWITWTSSDESHLAISNENRQSGADSLYSPYVGKVYQDSSSHEITLTAVITNPSTEISVSRTFNITISPMSQESLEQNLKTMSAILNCYTPEKLTDFVTKKALDISSVENDIQLVIPKKVVSSKELADLNYGTYWDYWNYKFTVTSSDTDVIEVNSFRAYVYRPLGESSSADKQVTLTVKMASKANPNLYVTKDITVTVKHLSRQEINDALALMDQAKFSYSDGLLGYNSDAYSIIDNLTPYNEIVWNEDKSGVEFIYSNADMTGNGIIVDAIPGWESQEDWRLFHSSDKDLIANETLILNRTPDTDTFVKINSVLTDEVFGKYYTKFANDESYNVEALAKFQQLYKQPVSAYLMVPGADRYTVEFATMSTSLKLASYIPMLTAYKNELDTPISVNFTLLGLDGSVMIPKTQETSFTKGATVFDVFKKILGENNISYSAKGSYISSINGLAELQHGGDSGWMYSVNGIFVNSYMNAQELYGGENIIVMYVRDYSFANMKSDNTDNGGNGNNSNSSNDSGSGATDTTSPAGSSEQTEKDNKDTDIADTEKASNESKNPATGKNDIQNGVSDTDSGSGSSTVAVQNGSNTLLIIVIAAALILILALVLLLILFKRRRQD